MNITGIPYLTHTWNPIAMRCSRVSEGCDHCWHIAMCKRHAANPALSPEVRTARAGGHPIMLGKELDAPLGRRKPAKIGVQFMGDLFHKDIKGRWIAQIFQVMADCPQHTFLVLTKRPKRAAAWFARWWNPNRKHRFCRGGKRGMAANLFLRRPGCSECRFHFLGCLRGRKEWKDRADKPNWRTLKQKDWWGDIEAVCDGFAWSGRGDQHGVAVEMSDGYIGVRQDALATDSFPAPLRNVWLAVSVENQAATSRIGEFMKIPAAVRFLSLEPMLEAVEFEADWLNPGCPACGRHEPYCDCDLKGEWPLPPRVDWVIVGGESGPGCRPFKSDWARSIRDQCQAAGVAFWMKQLGGHPDKRERLDQLPCDLRIRELPD